MSRVFQLGPHHWRRRLWPSPRRVTRTPRDLRMQVRDWTSRAGVQSVLMEDEPQEADEDFDPAHKFNRILDDHDFEAIFVIWPYRAKMAATWDELLYLVERQRSQAIPAVHAFVQSRAASFDDGYLRIKERGDRSSYLHGVHRLTIRPWYWRNLGMLESAVSEACEIVTSVVTIPPIRSESTAKMQDAS